MFSLHQNVDRLRSERQLDAASAASFPYLEKDGQKKFLSAHDRRRRQGLAESAVPGRPLGDSNGAPFTVDGKPVTKEGLVRWLQATFGGSPFANPVPAGGNGHDNGQVRP